MTRFSAFEDLLNRQIRDTTPARSLLGQLDGKVLELRLRETSLSLYVEAGSDGIEIATESGAEPDAIITATPLGFLKLTGPDAATSFSGSSVHIEGDAECARAFQRLFEIAKPDWEEEVARVVGDVAAHQLGNLVRSLKEFSSRAVDTMARNTAEFLREESRDVPDPAEVEEFLRDVDDLSADFDRVRVRLKKLEALLDSTRGSDS